jgi:hypothetical protein
MAKVKYCTIRKIWRIENKTKERNLVCYLVFSGLGIIWLLIFVLLLNTPLTFYAQRPLLIRENDNLKIMPF